MKISRRSKPKTNQFFWSIALVALSVVGVFIYTEQTKITETFLITKADLASGTAVSEVNFEQVEIALFGAAKNYLRPNSLPEAAFLTKPLAKGDLVPLSAIGGQLELSSSNLIITPTLTPSSSITPGQLVSLWSSPRLDYSSFGEPVLLAVDAEVVKIIEAERAFVGTPSQVELRLPFESIKSVLQSIANNDALFVTGLGNGAPDA